MRLALLADVHGNLEALDAVLQDADRYAPGAELVCAGDVVGYGPDPEACIERLRMRGALFVMGNHEEMVLGRRSFARCVHAGIVAAVWTHEHLSPSAKAFLDALPSWADAAPGVVVCHGDLASADTYVSTPVRAREALAQLRILRSEARVLICGHTHHAAFFTAALGFRKIAPATDIALPPSGAVINPGAVGQARDDQPLASYAVLDLDRGVVSYRALDYDHSTTIRKLRRAGLVARVVMLPPRGLARRVERLKTRRAYRWAARRLQRSGTQTADGMPLEQPIVLFPRPATSEARVTVVIVAYNSREGISAALDSANESYKAGIVAECVVIDNQSADDTAELVRRTHPWSTLFKSEENLGFGRASNIGIHRAHTPYVLLLDPYAALTRGGLEQLVYFLDTHPSVGAAAPAIRQRDGHVQAAGGLLTPKGVLLEALGFRGVFADRRPILPGGRPFRTSWLCDAVVLLRKSMLDEVGAFDPRYFLYFEETDLWLRAQQSGWELWAVGDAVATHLQPPSAHTTGRRMYNGCISEYFFRSRFQYLTEHFGWPAAAAAELGELSTICARASYHLLRGRNIDDFWARLRAPVLGRPLPGANEMERR
jgi:GT2 family glycosyltransferase/predicted phosphodiesterase